MLTFSQTFFVCLLCVGVLVLLIGIAMYDAEKTMKWIKENAEENTENTNKQ